MRQPYISALAVAWFRQEDWPRWLEIDPNFEPDYLRWLVKAEAQFRALQGQDYVLEKCIIEPDAFLRWTAARGGEIDAKARATFAAFEMERRRAGDH